MNRARLIKVADFGSASLVEPSRLKALGITNLGITQTGDPRTASLTGTLMYLAPEVLSGQSPAASADVYALGVMLYQLAIGDFRKPISPGWEAGIEDPLIRGDIADAACGDPARRLASAAQLAERLLALDRRRAERDQLEQTRKREQIAERRRADSRIRRPWIVAAGVVLSISLVLSLSFYRRLSSRNPRLMTVAVLPFQTPVLITASIFSASHCPTKSRPRSVTSVLCRFGPLRPRANTPNRISTCRKRAGRWVSATS